MTQLLLTVANLKCSGCAATIHKRLTTLVGVQSAVADPELDSVTVVFEEPATRDQITELLAHLGYPEATAENGLLTQVKSYASCLVGRLHPHA